ncbi:hypothetical protein ENSA5_45460 [Enhygromyxa salina]|uniref:Uncharacterized protein n=1 Tax=Enhygromyxa salina TaxID=215803 RepID=A0A2S9XJL0_9BACT|nr:hypothetical protein ENSA5_45460 [Enhygromyxa salina]
MNLPQQSAHSGRVAAHEHEHVLAVKAHVLVPGDDLDVRQPLLVGADLVLALDDEDPARAEHTAGLEPRTQVEVSHGVVPLRAALPRVVGVAVCVGVAEGGMCAGSCPMILRPPEEALHVGRIQDEAVEAVVLVGQITAVDPVAVANEDVPLAHGELEVGGVELVDPGGDALPKHTLAEGHVGDFAARRDVQPHQPREQFRVVPNVRGIDEIGRRLAPLNALGPGHPRETTRNGRPERLLAGPLARRRACL